VTAERTAEKRAQGHSLLLRRSLDDPSDRAYYVTFAPRDGMLDALVYVAERPRSIEYRISKRPSQTVGWMNRRQGMCGSRGIGTSP
jgi:hypothetical protein